MDENTKDQMTLMLVGTLFLTLLGLVCLLIVVGPKVRHPKNGDRR